MALTVLHKEVRRVAAGQNGYLEVNGIAQFTDTDATGELPCEIGTIDDISVNNPIGAPATDETVYVDEAAQVVGGQLLRPATKYLTIGRTGASPTADLMFAFRYRGK